MRTWRNYLPVDSNRSAGSLIRPRWTLGCASTVLGAESAILDGETSAQRAQAPRPATWYGLA